MKLNPNNQPLAAALLGVLTMMARLGLYLLGTDGKGLLIPWHPLGLLAWLLTLAAVGYCVLTAWPLKGSNRYSDNFSPSTPAAIGAMALAGGITVTAVTGWNTAGLLSALGSFCGVAAVPALLALALARWQGKRPFFGFHAIACLYLTLYAVGHYQTWCSQPQLQRYFYELAAVLCLCLFAYQQTAFAVGMGKRRLQRATGLLAGFFCVAALADGVDPMLYLGGAVWALTNLCSPRPLRRRPSPAAPPSNANEAAGSGS